MVSAAIFRSCSHQISFFIKRNTIQYIKIQRTNHFSAQPQPFEYICLCNAMLYRCRHILHTRCVCCCQTCSSKASGSSCCSPPKDSCSFNMLITEICAAGSLIILMLRLVFAKPVMIFLYDPILPYLIHLVEVKKD